MIRYYLYYGHLFDYNTTFVLNLVEWIISFKRKYFKCYERCYLCVVKQHKLKQNEV